jgi:hypothetical protein
VGTNVLEEHTASVFRVLKFHYVFFWVTTPGNLIRGYQSFGRTYCIHLQSSEDSKYDLLDYDTV